jgi:hypothetical protein
MATHAKELPTNCLLDGPIPDPRKKRQEAREKEHGSSYHNKYGGAMNFAWFTRLVLSNDNDDISLFKNVVYSFDLCLNCRSVRSKPHVLH